MIERIGPEHVGTPIAEGHEARYRWAARHVRRLDDVNDVGCGIGYGASWLTCGIWRGIDRPGVADHRYRPVEGHQAWYELDLDDVELALPECDVTIAFEVLEHLEEPRRVAREIARTTTRSVLVSVPTVPTVGRNPFHRHNFTKHDVPPLFPGFTVAECWPQPEEHSHVWRLVHERWA